MAAPLNGPGLFLCRPIHRLIHRLRGDHSWRVVPGYTFPGRTYPPSQVCDPCETVRALLVEPPPGHPDSMVVKLLGEHERWLAELDARLFPQEATKP